MHPDSKNDVDLTHCDRQVSCQTEGAVGTAGCGTLAVELGWLVKGLPTPAWVPALECRHCEGIC